MEKKTSQSYKKEILEKYKKEKGGEGVGIYLEKPTSANIRNACILLLNKRNSERDNYILNHFFQFKNESNKLKEIQNFDADKFKPVVNFLKGKAKNTSSKNIELISWLIDFQPRPFQEYLNKNNFHSKEGVSQIKKREIDGEKQSAITKKSSIEEEETDDNTNRINKKTIKKWIIVFISIAFGLVLLILGVQKWSVNSKTNNLLVNQCMAWADSLYIPISCEKNPWSKYGTPVKPMDKIELKNMRKVKVNAAYPFFSEDGKPLIWYYKNKKGEIEYFTKAGLHPVNGETLRKITTHIIKTYVPIHTDKKSSFVP